MWRTFQMPTSNNLPAPRAPIIGRTQELDSVRRLLLREDVFLVTLTGPGGIGKTRLALQLAIDLLDSFEGGVFFVGMATIANPDLVLLTIARTLGLSETNNADPVAPTLQGLKNALHDTRMLLVIDGFEQVIAAASELYEL